MRGTRKLWLRKVKQFLRRNNTDWGKWFVNALAKTAEERHGTKCPDCLKPRVEIAFDHRVPLSRGGGTFYSNIEPMCAPCNRAKGNLTDSEWFELSDALSRMPLEARHSILARLKAGWRAGYLREKKNKGKS